MASYRSALAAKQVLVVLDNAASAAQVRPLLPGNPSCAVLVTNRTPLADLEGAAPLTLDLLTETEAVTLLARSWARTVWMPIPLQPSRWCINVACSRWRCGSPGPGCGRAPTGRS